MRLLLSEYIGKQVVKTNGEYAGFVINAELSKKLDTLRALVCADCEEEEFTIPTTAIKAFGGGGIIVKSLGGKLAKERVAAPIGRRALSVDGEFLGLISDFEIYDNKITCVILSNGESLPLYKIKGIGECIIIDLNALPPQAKTHAVISPKTKKEIEKGIEDIKKEPQFTLAKKNQITAGSNLLTGKIVPRDIFDVRGNTVIKKGSVITAETLKSAIFHNKLFELTVTVLNA